MIPIHPVIESLKFLIGKWESVETKGQYPTIDSFSYNEILEFENIGQPLLNYSSKSLHPETGRPMHLESGFLRVKPESNQVALVTAHNFGLVSVEEGTVNNGEITLQSVSIARMSFAKEPQVTGLRRTIQLKDDGKLEIVSDMQTTRTEYTNHLRVLYKKLEC